MISTILGRYGRYFAALTALLLIPSLGSAGVIFRSAGLQPDFKDGQIRFTPKSITLQISALHGGRANYTVDQKGNPQNRFRGQISCGLHVGANPHVDQDGEKGMIFFGKGGALGAGFDCMVTVLGAGGVTGAMPVVINVGV
jgi:hypothetical protein